MREIDFSRKFLIYKGFCIYENEEATIRLNGRNYTGVLGFPSDIHPVLLKSDGYGNEMHYNAFLGRKYPEYKYYINISKNMHNIRENYIVEDFLYDLVDIPEDRKIAKGEYKTFQIITPRGRDLVTKYLLAERIYDSNDERTYAIIVNKPSELFTVRSHPDCCGTNIAFSHRISSGTFEKLRDNNLFPLIKEELERSPKEYLAHISHNQITARDLLFRIGYEDLYEFRNSNSSNIMHVMRKPQRHELKD